MLNLKATNANEAFMKLFYIIKAQGVTVKNTKAVFNVGVLIDNPTEREIICPWRKWSNKYAMREWLWYLSGNRSVKEIKKFAPIWDRMHNGDNIVNSNYGYQWKRNEQLDKCIAQLKDDKDTRQAWITIYDGKEKDDYDFDTPCTLNVGFDIKPYGDEDKLDMTVLMRSNDLVYGFCNDQFCFSMLQQCVAEELGIKVGSYYHYAHNMHIYNDKLNLDETNNN